MTDNTHGQVPAIQRYKIGYRSDEWGQRSSTPSGIPDASGSWVRYADHVTALAAGQAKAAQSGLTDAYVGAREDLSIWKRRALEAEATVRNFVREANSPTFMGDPASDECHHGDAYIVNDCLRCGAPVCCGKCCAAEATPHGQVPVVLEDALSDAVRVPLDSLHADAAYLIGRLRDGSMPYALVIEIIRERIDAAFPTAQAAESVPDGPRRKDMLWSTVKMQERHDQRIENIVSGLERIKQEHAGQQPQKIDECYGDCPTDSTTCTNPCRFDGRAARAPADSVLEDAARYQWLFGARTEAQSACVSETVFKPLPQDEVLSHLQGFYMSKAVVDALVDAARKQGANHD